MRKAKITGDVVPVPCPKCGANEFSFHRSYTTSVKVKPPKGSAARPDVPINLMTCNKCKHIQGYALYMSYNFAAGRFEAYVAWVPMMVSHEASNKKEGLTK